GCNYSRWGGNRRSLHHRRKCLGHSRDENSAWFLGSRFPGQGETRAHPRGTKRHCALGLELRRNLKAFPRILFEEIVGRPCRTPTENPAAFHRNALQSYDPIGMARCAARVAHASRALVSSSRRNDLPPKSAKAGRFRQHARRVRYPELTCIAYSLATHNTNV